MQNKPEHHKTKVVRVEEILPCPNSDNLAIIPISEEIKTLLEGNIPGSLPVEGTDISDLIGVTHYQPPDPDDLRGENERVPNRPRSLKGWMYFLWWKFLDRLGFSTPISSFTEKAPGEGKPYYDIENFKNHKKVFEPGEMVIVTEKLHGCQGKYVFQDGKMYAGSRNHWKSSKSKCIWRRCLEQNSWIEEWCRANEGHTLYGEVIPCQGEKFTYGYLQGQVGFKVFDVLTPEHEWLSWEKLTEQTCCIGCSANIISEEIKFRNWVPVLYEGPYDPEEIKKHVDGKSTLGSGIREGIVIKPFKERHVRGLGRAVLKLISNQYLERS